MSSDQLADAILSFYESEEFRQQIARSGRARVRAMMRGTGSPVYEEAIGALLAANGGVLVGERVPTAEAR
jgi:hypothetical protein